MSIPQDKPNHQPKHQVHNNFLIRLMFLILGFLFLGLGILGVITPGLPTTVFILLAAACWARSSKRFYGWLLRHRIFGKMIIDWEERRAMPRFAKYIAWSMMLFSSAILFYRLPSERLWIAFLVSGICLGAGIWMARLPDA